MNNSIAGLLSILDGIDGGAARAKVAKASKPKDKTAREVNAAYWKSKKEQLEAEWKTAPDRALARKKTGYVAWTPVAIRDVLQWERCTSCGDTHLRFGGTFYVHENDTAHASWSHPEGMILPLDGSPLPRERVVLDKILEVPVCGECYMDELDLSPQLELPV